MAEETLDDVCEFDDYIRDNERIFKTDERCIGSVMYPDENGIFILDTYIDTQLFYKFNSSLIFDFLQLPHHPQHILFGKTEIVQIKMVDEAYTVVIKTFWIRIIQRSWKRYMKERNEWIKYIKKNILNYVFRNGSMPKQPTCNGILSYLCNKEK